MLSTEFIDNICKKFAVKDRSGSYRLDEKLSTWITDYALEHAYPEDKRQYLLSMVRRRFKELFGMTK